MSDWVPHPSGIHWMPEGGRRREERMVGLLPETNATADTKVLVTNFMGTSFMLLCLLGVFVADSFGRYLTIIAIFTDVKTPAPLMLAAMHGKIDCVLKLLQAGANSRQPAVAVGTSPKPPTGTHHGPIRQAGRRPTDLAGASQIIMAPVGACRSLALVLIVVAISVTGGGAAGSNKSLNITNNCNYTVWPGILSGAAASSASALDTTGFELATGEWRSMSVPTGWSGLLWGRTLCSTDATTGKFTCVTGDCGSGGKDCAGGGPAPPVTLAQFTLDGSRGMDWYDVSLVDGFNLPLLVAPAGGGGNCAPTGCVVDLNAACPAELRVTSGTGATVACKSACLAFRSPQYCCTGEYGTPSTCKPSSYSELFKKACPRAFSYAYDGAGTTFTCAGGDTYYSITFCPSTTSNPRSEAPETTGNLPPSNGGSTTPYTGGGGGAASAMPWRVALIVVVFTLVANWLGCCKAICSD